MAETSCNLRVIAAQGQPYWLLTRCGENAVALQDFALPERRDQLFNDFSSRFSTKI